MRNSCKTIYAVKTLASRIMGCLVGILLLACPFASMGQEIATDSVFWYEANDSTAVTVHLLNDTAGVPTGYSAHLITGVCADGLCRPVDIHIYWDLLGRFQDYKMSQGHPITKFDHLPLTEDDHAKLRRLLADTSSLLRDYAVEDMIDTTVKLQSGVLDAVTGATNPTFASITVAGAMYTVYTLWHFVNGPVRRQIRQHTQMRLTNELIVAMLQSDRLDYQQFLYERFTDEQRRQFAPVILTLIGHDDPYIPHFAIDQLTRELLADSIVQVGAINYIGTVATPVQNSLLTRIGELSLYEKSMQLILEAVPSFAASQLSNVFAILENNISSIKGGALQALANLSQQKGKIYSSYVTELTQRLPYFFPKKPPSKPPTSSTPSFPSPF